MSLFLSGHLALAQPDTEVFDRPRFLKLLATRVQLSDAELIEFYRRPPTLAPRRQSVGSEEKLQQLGKKLFFDPRLSRDRTLSCASCHNPELSWVDGVAQNREGNGRRSMTLMETAWDGRFTWTGRVTTITQQAALALQAPRGMNADRELVVGRLTSDPEYRQLFRAAFSASIRDDQLLSINTVSSALEEFLRTITAPETKFDRYVLGREQLSPAELNGFRLFNSKANCARCHNSWRFSDGFLYDTGFRAPSGHDREEQGTPRVTTYFKAVSLRNIADRPPYMHDGSLKTLEQVIDFYDRGGDIRRPTTSVLMKPLNLTSAEKHNLLAFLKTLSGSKP